MLVSQVINTLSFAQTLANHSDLTALLHDAGYDVEVKFCNAVSVSTYNETHVVFHYAVTSQDYNDYIIQLSVTHILYDIAVLGCTKQGTYYEVSNNNTESV